MLLSADTKVTMELCLISIFA